MTMPGTPQRLSREARAPLTHTRRKLPPDLLTPIDAYGWAQFLVPAGLLLAALWLASGPIPLVFAPLTILLVGILQYRVYFPLHETSHYTLFRSRTLNLIAGNICAGLLATPFSRFREEHLEHHRSFGTIDDPGGVDYFLHFRSRREFLGFLLWPLVGGALLLKLKDYWVRKGDGERKEMLPVPLHELFAIAGVQLVVAAIVTGLDPSQWWRYPLFYLLPGVTIFLFLSRLRMFLEHASLDYDKFDYFTSPRLTARTIYGSWWERLIMCGANFNYHHEHHVHPGVPAVHLPNYHTGYLRPEMESEDIRLSYMEALVEMWRSLGRIEEAERMQAAE